MHLIEFLCIFFYYFLLFSFVCQSVNPDTFYFFYFAILACHINSSASKKKPTHQSLDTTALTLYMLYIAVLLIRVFYCIGKCLSLEETENLQMDGIVPTYLQKGSIILHIRKTYFQTEIYLKISFPNQNISFFFFVRVIYYFHITFYYFRFRKLQTINRDDPTNRFNLKWRKSQIKKNV